MQIQALGLSKFLMYFEAQLYKQTLVNEVDLVRVCFVFEHLSLSSILVLIHTQQVEVWLSTHRHLPCYDWLSCV